MEKKVYRFFFHEIFDLSRSRGFERSYNLVEEDETGPRRDANISLEDMISDK